MPELLLTPRGFLSLYLAGVTLWALFLMGFDKARAKQGGRRVAEKSLFAAALLGGAAGGILGMYAFRHKTKHWYFKWGLPAILALQLGLVIWLALRP